MDAPRTPITADMIRPKTPDEHAMEAEWLAASDPDIDWLEWIYDDEASALNQMGVSFEEWEKAHNERVAAFVAKRAANNAA